MCYFGTQNLHPVFISSTHKCWLNVIEGLEKHSKDRYAMADCFSNELPDKIKQILAKKEDSRKRVNKEEGGSLVEVVGPIAKLSLIVICQSTNLEVHPIRPATPNRAKQDLLGKRRGS